MNFTNQESGQYQNRILRDRIKKNQLKKTFVGFY